MEGWSVRFRHDGVLITGAGEDTLLDGRAAALFTYLVIEGPTSRRALAALLWPDAEPHRGRANLRKLLSRLGSLREALSGPDPLGLRPETTTNEEELLPESLGLDDASSLTAWLEQARERRRQRRITWLHGEIDRHEVAGHGRAALESAEKLLELEPNEATVREALALAGRLGHVEAGLGLYRAHRRRLARDFDAEPDASTQALARQLARTEADDALALLLTEGARLHGADGSTAMQRLDVARPAWIAAWERAVAECDAASLARAADPLSDYFELRGDPQHAVTLLTRAHLALNPPAGPGERRAAARILIHVAWHEQRLGLPTAGANAERGLALLSPDDDAAHRAQALYAAGRAMWARGDIAAARHRWDQAHAQLEGATDGLRAAYLHGNVAMAADALGETERAKRHYRSALEGFRRNGAEAAATSCINNLGQLLVDAGDVDEGLRLLDHGIELATAHDQRATLAYLLDGRCQAALAVGRPEEAHTYLRQATVLARSCSDRVLSASLLASEARIALAENDGALPKALNALAAAHALGLRPAVLDALLLIARALQAAGAASEADRVLTTLAREEGAAGIAARDLLDDRQAEPVRDVDTLVQALVAT